jgi:hypothetical protein
MTRTVRMSFARKLAGSALAVVAGLGVVTVTGGPAMAATCTLDFNRPSVTVYQLTLVRPNATPISAVQLWAEDFPFDQFLGNFRVGQLVDQGTLDEDDSPFNRGDEIYGKVTVQDVNGNTEDVRTNTVHRNF